MTTNRMSTAQASKVRPRMRYAPRAVLAGVLGFATSFVVACGGGAGLLSTDQASTLSDQLNQISSNVQAHDCTGTKNGLGSLSNDVQGLPLSVNPTLRSNLAQGVATVQQLANVDCHQSTRTQTTTTSSTTTTTQTSTTQTTTTTTSPTSTTTSATTTTAPGTTSTGTGGAGGGAGIGTGTNAATGNVNSNAQ
jgi:hypothetical protein